MYRPVTNARPVFRPLYDWTLRLAGHRRALPALAGISFIESSVFPIPPDVMLVPMVLARPERAWLIALVCTVASVAGGLAGYAIGYFLYEAVGIPILEFYGYLGKFTEFQHSYNEWGWWIVFGAGLTPFPFKVITIASGVTALDPVVFTLAALVSRGARFFIVAALLWRFGPAIRELIERRFALLTVVFFVLLIGGFVSLRYVV